jgi:hypothetical protein
MQDNRRKHKRFEARWKTAIAYSVSDKKPIFHTLTHDLSVNGTSVQSNTDEKKDSLLTLLLIPPEINGVAQKVIKLKSVVMSSRPYRNGYRLGLNFIHDAELEKLWVILNNLDLSGDELPSDPDLAGNKENSAPAAAPPVAAPSPAAPAPSVLDLIKQRTAQKLQSEEQQAAARLEQQRALYKRISVALMGAYKYFGELSTQLNQLKPEYPTAYTIPKVAEFKNLVWREDAMADCTPRQGLSPHEEKTFDRVSMTFTLANPTPLKIECDPIATERAENALTELGYEYSKQMLKSASGSLAGYVLSCPCEVKVRLAFSCDDANSKLFLDTLNLERFGKMRYEFDIDALNQALLDQLTLMMLGEPNTVGKLIKRVA